jgi:hypothetical protein
MSGRLHLHLNKYLLGDAVERAAIASVRAIPSSGSIASPAGNPLELVIPSGSAPPLQVDLEPGRYLVQAELPSGDLIADEVDIAEEQDSVLNLRTGDSPHEWLSWPQLLGRVESAEEYYAGTTPPVPAPTEVGWLTEVDPERHDVWEILAGRGRSEDDLARQVFASSRPIEPIDQDEVAQLYQVVADGSWDRAALPDASPPHPGVLDRRYLRVTQGPRSRLVCLPAPWTSLNTETEVPIQVLVRAGGAISVIIRDPLLGAALGFLTSGSLPAAERLFDQARHVLYRKQTNPLGAAGAGYVLLGTEQGSEPKEWHGWIANMLRWFEWIPDGAIQHAWLKLRHRATGQDLDDARAELVTAYRRGLPFYSIGLQWLVNGLTFFAGEDREVARMLANVQQVARRTDLRETFTIVRMPDL